MILQGLSTLGYLFSPRFLGWGIGFLLIILLSSQQVQAAIPTYQAAGTARGGSGRVTPTWPAHQTGDLALLFVESAGGQTVTLRTAANFVEVAGSPQFTGTTTTGTRITVFWARATSSGMANPTVEDAGNHVNAQILTYRGVILTGNPWDVTSGGNKATASASVTVTGVTTTVTDALVVQVCAKDLDSTAAGFSAQTNTNLTNLTERIDIGTNAGNGGGFAVWDGGKATAGNAGNTTATVTTSVNAFLTIALKPEPSVGSTNPAKFNCVESGASASTGTIYTKLAGSTFSFDVVALKADGTVETSYAASTNKNVTVELVDDSGATCAIPINPAVSQTLTFAAANLGRKPAASMTVSKAYPNLRCRVTDANQLPSIVGCSTDNFAVRPSGFTVTSSINADATGLSNSATPVLKTGGLFTLTAASGVAGYSNAPSLDTSKVSAHSGAVQTGTLAGSFGNADSTTGLATGSAFTYSEVGYFNLAANGVYDDSFTAVDSAVGDCTADFSNVADGSGKVGCKFGNTSATPYFGRFIPDHFALTPGSATPACSSSFTYFGQDGFNTSFTLIAQNAGNITTQNYQGGFARLGLTAWGNYNFSSASLPAGSLLSASATSPVGAWNQGIANVTATHQASRPTAVTGETSVVVQAAPIDSDGVTMTSTAVAAGTPLRYGRLFLQNAYGSELMDLPVSLTAQYWNGSAFVLNTNDSCTTVSAPASGAGLTFYPEVATSAQGNHLSAAETAATVSATGNLVAGDGQLKFSAPGSANDGYLDISIQAPNWLKFDWNAATAGDEFPAGRATFGIYKGNDIQIYLREVY